MAAAAPLAIGTRGTVGSLLKKEIEYFTKFELERRGSSWKPHGQLVEMDCRSGHSRPSFWLLVTGWKRKKRRGGSGFLPRSLKMMSITFMFSPSCWSQPLNSGHSQLDFKEQIVFCPPFKPRASTNIVNNLFFSELVNYFIVGSELLNFGGSPLSARSSITLLTSFQT
ncbi:hypothetical protein CRYUN_Cryun37aG0122500 [Craigia yunnanensis]